MAMLDVKNLSISFGGLKAVDDFSITIEKGQLYGLIGPNGAGKTTIFNLLTGVYKPDGGRILLDGKDITGHKAIQINQAGIARTFQNYINSNQLFCKVVLPIRRCGFWEKHAKYLIFFVIFSFAIDVSYHKMV